jgi:hypothetical protein
MGEFPYLDNSTDFYWIPPGYTNPISYDSVASILNSRATFYTSIQNGISNLVVTPLSPTLASYHGIVKSYTVDTAGVYGRYKLEENGIMIKRKDGWKLLQGQTSLIRASEFNAAESDSLF